MKRVLIEVCVDSPASLQAAVDGGADRVELCSALELGGLTPTTGLQRAAKRAPIPVHAMIRPRAGDFHFTADELEQMVADIAACRAAGFAGVVIGAADRGRLDRTALSVMAEAAGPLSLTLHRVFDVLDDRMAGIETAAALGIDRILTSGGAAGAPEGAGVIRRCVEQADGRLAIMAGGGVRAANVAELVRQTGVTEIHGSFSRPVRRYAAAIRQFGFSTGDALVQTDARLVGDTRRALDAA